MIYSNTAKIMEFWEIYMKDELKFSKLIKLDQEIEKESDNIERLWENFITRSDYFSSDMLQLYSNYIRIARNRLFRSQNLKKTYKMLVKAKFEDPDAAKIISEDTLRNADTFSIFFAADKNLHRRICQATYNISKIFGLSAEEITQKSIFELVPETLISAFQSLINSCLESDFSYLNKNLEFCFKNKDGNLVPVYIYISFCPYVQVDPILICLIKVRSIDNEFALLDKDGKFDSFTIGMKKLLYRSLKGNSDVVSSSSKTKNKKHHYFEATDEISSAKNSERHITFKDKIAKFNNANKLISSRFNNSTHQASELADDFQSNYHSFINEVKEIKGEQYEIKPESIEILGKPFKILSAKQKEMNEFNAKGENFEPHFEVADELDYGVEDMMMFTNQKKTTSNKEIKLSNKKNAADSSSEEREAIDPEEEKKDQIHETSSVNSVLSQNHLMKMQENALYEVPAYKSLGYVRIIIILYIIICSAFLVGQQTISNNNLSKAKEDTNILLTLSQLMVMATEISRRIRMLSLISENLLDVTRQAVNNQPNILKGIIGLLYTHAQFISQLNTNLKNGLARVDPKFQAKINNRSISYIERGASGVTRYVDVYTMTNEITAALLKLSKTDAKLLTSNNTDIRFLLNNTIDSYMVEMEEIVEILIQDPKIKLNEISDSSLIFFIVAVGLGCAFFVYLFKLQYEFMKSRLLMIQLFARIDHTLIRNYLMNLKSIFELILTGHKASHNQNINLSRRTGSESGKKNTETKKHINIRGLNKNVYFTLFIAVCIIILAISGFIAIQATYESFGSRQNINNQIEVLKKISIYYYQIRILGTTMYSYVGERANLTLRTRPYSPEWEALYDDTTNFQQYLRQVADDSRTSADMKSLISGNLCSWFTSPINYTTCLTFAASTTQRGLLGINSWMLYTLRIVKDYFDGTNKTWSDQRNTLDSKNLISMEALIGNWMIPGYLKLQQLFIDQISGIIDEYHQIATNITIVFVVLLVILGTYIQRKLCGLLIEERIIWRKLFRIIPIEAIASNKGLKLYLSRQSSSGSVFMR